MTKLQEILIERIAQIEDEALLEDVRRLLDMAEGVEEDVYYLNEEQMMAVAEAEEDYRNGRFITNEEMNRQIDEWLKNR